MTDDDFIAAMQGHTRRFFTGGALPHPCRDEARAFPRCRDFAIANRLPDPRVQQLLQRLSLATGLPIAECEHRIERLAQ